MTRQSTFLVAILFSFILSGCVDAADSEEQAGPWQGVTLDYGEIRYSHVSDATITDVAGRDLQVKAILIHDNRSEEKVTGAAYFVDPVTNLVRAVYDPGHLVCTSSPKCEDLERFERLREPVPWLFGVSSLLWDLDRAEELANGADGWTVNHNGTRIVLSSNGTGGQRLDLLPDADSLEFEPDRLFPVQINTKAGDVFTLQGIAYETIHGSVQSLRDCSSPIDMPGSVVHSRFPVPVANRDYYAFPWEEAWDEVVAEYPSFSESTLVEGGMWKTVTSTRKSQADPLDVKHETTMYHEGTWSFLFETKNGPLTAIDIRVRRNLPEHLEDDDSTEYFVDEPRPVEDRQPVLRGNEAPHRELGRVVERLSGTLGREARNVFVESGVNDDGPWTAYKISADVAESSRPYSVYLQVDVENGSVLRDIRMRGALECAVE